MQQVFITNKKNEILFRTGYDSLSNQRYEPDISPKILTLLTCKNKDDTRTTIQVQNRTAYLLGSAPIIPTNLSGSVEGTIIFGREIKNEFITNIERSVHYPVRITISPNLQDSQLLTEYQFPKFFPEITYDFPDMIGNSFSTRSPDSQHIIIFSINRPKDVAILGREILSKSILFFILMVIGLLIIMNFILIKAFNRYEREQHELLSTIIRFYPDATFAVNIEGTIIAWNQSLSKILGKDLGEMIGSKDISVITGKFGSICSTMISFILTHNFEKNTDYPSIIQIDKRLETEIEILSDTGKRMCIWVTAAPIYNSSGELFGAIESFRDTTDRKEAEERAIKIHTEKELLIKNEELSLAYEELAATEEELRTNYEELQNLGGRLSESEERFRFIIHAMQFGIIIIDAHTHTIVDANKKALEMIGGSSESVVGSICHRFICPADLGRCPVSDLGQTVDSSERILLTIQGKSIPIIKSVIKTTLGKRDVLIESFIDITERTRVEIALKESEDRLRSFIEQMLEGVTIVDRDGRIIEWNPAQEKITGIPRTDAMGMYTWDLATRMIPDPNRRQEICSRIKRDIESSILTGISTQQDMENYRFCRPDGTIAIVTQTVFIIKTSHGNMIGTLNQDITEHRLAEDKIKESEVSYRGIFNSIKQAIYIIDQDSKFIDVNQGAEAMYGFTREEFIGKTPEFLSAPGMNDLVEVAGFLRKAFDGEPQVFEFRGLRKNTGIFPKEVRLYKGTFFGEAVIIAIGTDITLRKQMEEALLSKTALFEAQAESTLDGILVINEKNERIFVNQHLIDMWGIPTDILEDPNDEVLLQYVVMQTKNPELFYQKVKYLYEHPQEISRDIIEFLNGRVYDRYSAPVIDRSGQYHGRIWTFRDLTDFQRMEESLRSRTALFEAQAIAHLGNWEWNVSDDRIFISDELCRIFGIDPNTTGITYHDLIHQVSPGDQELVRSSVQALITAGRTFRIDFKIILPNGAERIARGQGEAEWNSEGNIHRISWIVHDITDLKRLEEDLKNLIQEKETLLKEIHHRVKNNMQVISSLISIQCRQVSDPSIQNVLKDIQNRVRSFGLVHELLYKSPNLNEIHYREYLSELTRFLFESYSFAAESVTCITQADQIRLDIEKAVPCSLILNELITNSLKYAFPDGMKGEIRISITLDPESSRYCIDYQDNGIGFASDEELKKEAGLGTTLIQGLTRQLSGTITREDRNRGAHYRISFPSGLL
ncbi:MAG TPA: PAS domain S-box protein [Methanospirillum sp.]|nr:PAS domain S-box protein [Methanospirillum sp.]